MFWSNTPWGLYGIWSPITEGREDFEDQSPFIEDGQTTQWSKEKGQKHTHKTKDRVTRTPLKTGGKLMCSGRVSVPVPLVENLNFDNN